LTNLVKRLKRSKKVAESALLESTAGSHLKPAVDYRKLAKDASEATSGSRQHTQAWEMRPLSAAQRPGSGKLAASKLIDGRFDHA
jgi:hypothetical protein